MKSFSFNTLRSSFWRWFVAILLINQLVLFTILYFQVLRPASAHVGRLIGSVVKASALAIHQDPQHGVQALQNAVAGFAVVHLDADDAAIEPIPRYFMGYRIIQAVLEKEDPNLRVGYTVSPVSALVVQSSELPGLTMRLALSGPAYVAQVLVFSMVLMLLVGALAAFWIAARLVQPLLHLSVEADRLGRDKDYRRIDALPGSSREVSQLANKLNEMRAALDASMQEREALLAGVAHDLRTPLSRMRLAIELEGDRNPKFTHGLSEDAVEMGAVMEQFIELSRLNLEVDEPWQIGDLNALVQSLSEKYRRARIDLSLDLAEGMPPVRHKPLALMRLLYNLVDNAYRHGNGIVTVQTTSINGKVVLTVENPISSEDEETGLMRAFHKQSSGQSAGLGLSIVRRFAEVHAAALRETTENSVRQYTLEFQAV